MDTYRQLTKATIATRTAARLTGVSRATATRTPRTGGAGQPAQYC